MSFAELSEQNAQAYQRYQALRREVLRLRIDNARNEGLLALIAAIDSQAADERHTHGQALAELSDRRAAAYRRMAHYRSARAVFGRRASNNLHHSGLVEETL